MTPPGPNANPTRPLNTARGLLITLMLLAGTGMLFAGASPAIPGEPTFIDIQHAQVLLRDEGPPGPAAPAWLDEALWKRLLHGEEIPIDEIPGFPYTIEDLQAEHDCIGVCPALPYTHIRPGAALGTTQLACTANFVFHHEDRMAIGTAGHCTTVGQTHGTLLVNTEHAIGYRTIGDTLESTAHGVIGDDFALIEIDPRYHHLVDPAVSVLDGPCAWRAPNGLGDPLQQYGHGLGWGAGGQTRHGAVVSDGGSHVIFLAAPGVAWGDSGSPARFAGTDLAAAAVLTHALPLTPYALGTSMPRVFEIMDSWGMSDWQLSHSPNCL